MFSLSEWWLLLLPIFAAFGVLLTDYRIVRKRLASSEAQRNDAAAELERRIAELFSLRELGYVLSESLQQERVVEQVARFVARFLPVEGVLVAVVGDGDHIEVAAAEGSMALHIGRTATMVDVSLVASALERGRIEVDIQRGDTPVRVLADITCQSAAIVPLSVRGERVGALAVVDHKGGTFTTEDLWLLSAVATSASVVLLNSRLFALAERGREEWETAFDALREGLALLDRNGRIRRANSTLAALADRPLHELLGHQLAGLFFEGAASVQTLLTQAGEGRHPPPLLVGGDEGGRLFRLTATPVSVAFGAHAVIALIEDVTEQRALETQVIQTEKMAAIGQLVSGVAHELNNPLTSIAGLSELLLEQGTITGPAREHLRIIHDQSDRAGRIVRNLLTFARRGEPQKIIVDLNEIAERTVTLVDYELRLREVELDFRPAAVPVEALGDPFELQQVLLNLLTNAIQALTDQPPEAPRRIALLVEEADGHAILRVRDSGAGVPEPLISRLFTPFFTTKPAGQGTGLGLPISYGIIKAHAGTLTYATAPEGGAEFAIELPRHLALARDTQRQILIIDTDASVQRLAGALFAPDGHRVDTAAGPDAGLGAAAGGEYDLVLVAGEAITSDGRPLLEALHYAQPAWKSRIIVIGRTTGTEVLPHQIARPIDIRELRKAADAILRDGQDGQDGGNVVGSMS